jgi:hypothetical protein
MKKILLPFAGVLAAALCIVSASCGSSNDDNGGGVGAAGTPTPTPTPTVTPTVTPIPTTVPTTTPTPTPTITPAACTLATAVPSCSSCHGNPPAAPHPQGVNTCATCHGPVARATGTPSSGMTAVSSGAACTLNYPLGGTHGNGATNFGNAQ